MPKISVFDPQIGIICELIYQQNTVHTPVYNKNIDLSNKIDEGEQCKQVGSLLQTAGQVAWQHVQADIHRVSGHCY